VSPPGGKTKDKEKAAPTAVATKSDEGISYKQAMEVLQMIILFSKLRSKVLPLGTLYSHGSTEHLFLHY